MTRCARCCNNNWICLFLIWCQQDMSNKLGQEQYKEKVKKKNVWDIPQVSGLIGYRWYYHEFYEIEGSGCQLILNRGCVIMFRFYCIILLFVPCLLSGRVLPSHVRLQGQSRGWAGSEKRRCRCDTDEGSSMLCCYFPTLFRTWFPMMSCF